ncbi:hypothetical protein FKM82_027240 [Ascaphus truei]
MFIWQDDATYLNWFVLWYRNAHRVWSVTALLRLSPRLLSVQALSLPLSILRHLLIPVTIPSLSSPSSPRPLPERSVVPGNALIDTERLHKDPTICAVTLVYGVPVTTSVTTAGKPW